MNKTTNPAARVKLGFLAAGALPFCLFPAAILWLELVLKLSTSTGLAQALPFMLLFSLAGGLFAHALVALLPHAWARRWTQLALLGALGVVFGIHYFVFCEFKMFYDLATVTKGASHAAHSFADQIAILVLNPSGIAHVVLFMLPFLAYAALMRRVPSEKASPRLVAGAAGCAAAAHLLAVALVAASGAYGLAYSERYSFQTAVQNYGLLASLRKEVTQSVLGQPKRSFSAASLTTAQTAASKDEDDAGTQGTDAGAQKERGEDESSAPSIAAAAPNALDIDFAGLAKTTEGTWAELDGYVAAQTPSLRNDMTGLFEGYNLVFVSAEAFSAEAIRKDTTPTLWRMATKGIQFCDYYQPASAGTTGGEYLNLFGMLPTDGGASVIDTATHNNYLTMGYTLNRLGYDGWAFHNNEYTYYSRDLTHNHLGYNHGYMGYGNGMEQWVEWQWPESDLEMFKGTWENLYGSYGDADHPFDVYYMSVSGHSLYGRDINAMSGKWWDEVADLPYSEAVRAYLAANIDLDRAMEYLIGQLEERGIADRTVIVIAADHFPYGLDDSSLGSLPVLSELYGHDVGSLLDRDHNRLIIWSGSLEKDEPLVVDSPTSSMDILPTLLNFFGAEWDSRLLPGRDVFSDRPALVFDLNYDWKTELGTYISDSDSFTPAERATVPEGYVEQMHAVVADKISYCAAVLESDYFRHVFGEEEDVDRANAAGKEARLDGSDPQASRELWGGDVIHRFKAKHHLK